MGIEEWLFSSLNPPPSSFWDVPGVSLPIVMIFSSVGDGDSGGATMDGGHEG